ncbi:MAG: transcriptional repressor [Candidatus Thermoplasmatota archaeon]|jgi:Fe2+ or Zn2+ uptake regulation protein|nr:transcriptional repressor [Candidatus Thermoplasmatota archaeon]MCL5789156.1 transcriptional repressor [Candidatus Thermoplasmatota archaeon]
MELDATKLLRDKGLKVTPQRISILRILSRGGHFTGEQVYSLIRKKEPSISISTVYNTLDTLDRSEILNSFEVNGMKWYESKLDSHVNVYCTDSNEVMDIDLDLAPLKKELMRKGLDATKISVIAYSECRKK